MNTRHVLLTLCLFLIPAGLHAQPAKALVKTAEAVSAGTKAVPAAVKTASAVPAYVRALETLQRATPDTESRLLAAYSMYPEAKKILNRNTQFEMERRAAYSLLKQTRSIHSVNNAVESKLLDNFSQVVVNRSLQDYLLNAMADGNYEQVRRDLANYYSLSSDFLTAGELRLILPNNGKELFAATALAYMKDHPHKMNLKLRAVMKNPNVEAGTKAALQYFISAPSVPAEQEEEFLNALREGYTQYENAILEAYKDKNVINTIDAYRQTLLQLEAFIDQSGHAPGWYGDHAERVLHNRLSVLMQNPINHFSDVQPYISEIRALLNKYPITYLPKEQTFDAMMTFVQQHGVLPAEWYSTHEYDPEVRKLVESISYWHANDNDFRVLFAEFRLQNL